MGFLCAGFRRFGAGARTAEARISAAVFGFEAIVSDEASMKL
jgi:hypothetical protein